MKKVKFEFYYFNDLNKKNYFVIKKFDASKFLFKNIVVFLIKADYEIF